MPGEDPQTDSAIEARRWAELYRQLAVALMTVHQRLDGAAAPGADRQLIDTSLEMAREREAFWRRRHDELVGLFLDEEEASASFNGATVHLTRRELQLLQFLINHPDRYWRAAQLSARGWGDSRLPVEQVRTYVARLRAKLAELGAPGEIVSRNPLGYRYRWMSSDEKASAG